MIGSFVSPTDQSVSILNRQNKPAGFLCENSIHTGQPRTPRLLVFETLRQSVVTSVARIIL